VIVLDEQLLGRELEYAIGRWYRGSVCFVTDLRPGTIIKDEAIPSLLCQQRLPTFVTINANHFWQKIGADRRFCIVCFKVLDKDVPAITRLLRLLFRKPEFNSKTRRAGHVFRMNIHERVQFYSSDNGQIQDLEL
jgi:hypothetical protein